MIAFGYLCKILESGRDLWIVILLKNECSLSGGHCQRVNCTLPPSSIICMRPIRPLLLDDHHLGACHLGICYRPLRGLFPKQPSLYHDYQLPDHLYISMRITLIKAPMQVNSYNQLSVMPSHYNSHNLRWWGLSNHTYNSLIYSNVHIRNVEGRKRTLPNAQMLAPNCMCPCTNA